MTNKNKTHNGRALKKSSGLLYGVLGIVLCCSPTLQAESGLSQNELSMLMADPILSDSVEQVQPQPPSVLQAIVNPPQNAAHANQISWSNQQLEQQRQQRLRQQQQRQQQLRLQKERQQQLRAQRERQQHYRLLRRPVDQATAQNFRYTKVANYSGVNNSPYAKKLPANIARLLKKSGMRSYGMSAIVLPADGNTPIMSHNASIPRTPASVMKLITTYSALGMLGANYRWKTDVYIRGHVNRGTLNGDLILKGHGDPDFTTNDIKNILSSLRTRHGIRNLKGRVILDNSYFKVLNRDSGRFDGKRYSAYNAIPDALMYNERISRYTVKNVGRRAKVYTSTPAANVRIVNKIRSVRGRCRGRARSPNMKISNTRSGKVVTFSGRFSRRCGTRQYAKVLTDPSSMIYSSIKTLWKSQVGGSFRGKFVRGVVPRDAHLIHSHHSKPLHEIIKEVNKDSNNVMARQLLLTVGAHRYRTTGNEKNGAQAIKQWLSANGLHFPELRIENGSGLSRVAKISAKNLAKLLHHAYNSPYRDTLMQSLAVAGVDGTMKRRLRSTNVRGRGYFKTGTLRNVRSIAGYVRGSDGRMYIVSIIHNDPKARSRGLKSHDELIKWAFDTGRSQHLAMR